MGLPSVFNQVLKYPHVRRDESVVDNYHGVMVPDPYRWLEDHDSEETKEFVRQQNELTDSVLKTCEIRDKLREKATQSFDFAKYDPPFWGGDKMFYMYNSGLMPEPALYVQEGLEGKPEVLIDPNVEFNDGIQAFADYVCKASYDGKYMVYGTTIFGSDFCTLKVMVIDEKRTLPDSISWTRFPNVTWTHDNKGFFYGRYPATKEGELDTEMEIEANQDHQIYYHVVGTDQSEDILCWSDPVNSTESRNARVTDDGKYLVMRMTERCDPYNKVYLCDLSSLPNGLEGYKGSNEMLPFEKLVDNYDAEYKYVANDDTIFTFTTNKDAPRKKIVRVDLKDPTTWTTVVEEHEKDLLEDADAVNGNQILVKYLSDVKNVLQIRDLKTGDLVHKLPLEIGAVSDKSCRRNDSLFFIEFTSFVIPPTIYMCNLEDEKPELRPFKEVVVSGIEPDEFEVDQIFVPSKDCKVKIPVFTVGKKGYKLDGSHPLMLHGYGGFGICIAPFFSVTRLSMVKYTDAIFCIGTIRGGGEYGLEWHKAAALSKKQVSYDDFITVSEHLISAGYTQSSKLCIDGASNGGLLVAACLTQRPDLFCCVLADASVFDMLRFHKFTIGRAWTSDYGCSENEEEFHWQIKYSPLHNVRRPWDNPATKHIQYPATMLCTADHDDRVVPLHTYKLLATIQYELITSLEDSPQTNPILGRIEVDAGHGTGFTTQDLINEAVDQFSFFAKAASAVWTE